MPDIRSDLKEAEAILDLVHSSEGERDALTRIEMAGYSEKDAEWLLDSALEILHIANRTRGHE